MKQIRKPANGYIYAIAKRDENGEFKTWYNKGTRKDGRVSLYNKEELKKIKVSKDFFILRVNSKAFKKMYSIEYIKTWNDGHHIIRDEIGAEYISLYRKALKSVKGKHE